MKKILYFLFIIPGILFSQWVDIADRFYGDNNGDLFGWETAINHEGDIIAISGYEDVVATSGYVKVFQHIGDDWVQIGETIPNPIDSETDGRNLAINAAGNIVAISSFNGGNNNTGAVRVYEFVNGVWGLIGDPITSLSISGNTESLALNASGTIVALGIPKSNSVAYHSGEVNVYQFDGNSWEQLGSKLTGNSSNTFFGNSLDLNAAGDFLVVGAHQGNNDLSGFVKVYKFINGDWQKIGQTLSGNQMLSFFGEKVAINNSGNIISILAGSKSSMLSYGYSKVYELGGNSWDQKGNTIILSDLSDYIFGSGFDLNGTGDVLAIGAELNLANTKDTRGEVIVYKCIDDNWQIVSEKIEGDVTYSGLGHSVSLNSDGNVLVSGAPFFSTNSTIPPNLPGFVRVLRTDDIILNAPTNNLETIVLYPNPTNGHFQINVNPEIVNHATAVDALGREIELVMDKSAFNLTFDISNLQGGVFFIKLDTVDGVVVKPIIKN